MPTKFIMILHVPILAIAFHPNFERNGPFFVSFCCDGVQWPGCVGRCSCNSDVGCDPSKLSSDNGVAPCQYHVVIVEFTANSSVSQPSQATSANPLEMRRIFTIGIPYENHHGGQILFGQDGFLYFMLGDGGSRDDPYNFAQIKRSSLGKILRIDVDNIPSAKEISDLDLWGNYSIPRDNPYSNDKDSRPEIWALGLRNPWRCSFDSERPSYFLCADSGQEQYEEVDIITKAGNYGWRVYEGTLPFYAPSPGGNIPSSSINAIFPVMGYNHSNGSSSIIGGYIYRSTADPCMYGRYLYADLYGTVVWAAKENPVNSGNFTSAQVPFTCAHDSPVQCPLMDGSHLPDWGYMNIVSFGEDNKKDVIFLTTTGLFRIVTPSRCNYSCSLENNSKAVGTPVIGSTSSPRSDSWFSGWQKELAIYCFLFLLLGSIR